MTRWLFRMAPGALGLTALVAVWWLTARAYSPEQYPGPAHVVRAWLEVAQDGSLWRHIGVSLGRFAVAFSLAVGGAIPLGLVLGCWSLSLRVLDPVLQVLRPISPIAWFPLAVLWFGIGHAPAIFIITLAAFFPLLLATVGAVRQIPTIYLRVAANTGASWGFTLRAVLFPAAFPGILVGLRIALGTAWIHLVAGEMLGAQSGLGFLIIDARNFLRTDLILAGMLTIGLLGLLLDRVVALVDTRVRRAWGLA